MYAFKKRPDEDVRGDDPAAWAVISGLRFVLAAIVVLGHCSLLVAGPHDWTYIGMYLHQVSAVFGFFIISGYSIAASLERSAQGFYRRRFARIWPLYLGCIAFGLLATLAAPRGFTWPTGIHCGQVTLISIIASFLMLQTILGPSIPIVGQIWSLCPEWWHYMVAPGLKKFSTVTLLVMLGFSFTIFVVFPTPPGGGGLRRIFDAYAFLVMGNRLLVPQIQAHNGRHCHSCRAFTARIVHGTFHRCLDFYCDWHYAILRGDQNCPEISAHFKFTGRYQLSTVSLPYSRHGLADDLGR